MKLKDLAPNPENPRKITKEKKDMMKKSLESLGDVSGFVFNIRTNRLAAGHQKHSIFPGDSGITIIEDYGEPNEHGTVRVGFVDVNGEKYKYREVDVDEPTEKAMSIASNKHSGDWDNAKLSDWILELDSLNIDMGVLGFDEEELADLMAPVFGGGLSDEDEVPPAPRVPKSKQGDLYILGDHRLLCGDSTNMYQVDRLLAGEKVDLIFTDPPYNVAFNGRSGNFDVIKNDNMKVEDFENFIGEVVSTIISIEAPNYYVWCNWKFYSQLQTLLPFKACIVWAKNVFGMGIGYRHQHEFCLFNGTIDEEIKNESDLWSIAKDHSYVHPTQKPVELCERALKNHKSAMNVLDLFGGSGSTLIGCEKNNRKCFMMELDPIYVDVIVSRWEKFTGKKAELVKDDR